MSSMISAMVRVRLVRRLRGDAGRLAEVFEQRAVEAVEDDEVGFVGELLALARAAAEHLLEEDAGLHRAEEDDEFQIGNIDAGREHIDRHHDAGLLAVAELADALERAVHGRAAGDLLDERVAAAENIARDVDELIGVGRVRQVVGGEDQRLGKAAVPLFVLQRRTS